LSAQVSEEPLSVPSEFHTSDEPQKVQVEQEEVTEILESQEIVAELDRKENIKLTEEIISKAEEKETEILQNESTADEDLVVKLGIVKEQVTEKQGEKKQ